MTGTRLPPMGQTPRMTQAQATFTAALVAAGLSALTLTVTVVLELLRHRQARRQETIKWARTTFHQAALDYTRAAYAMSGLSGEARRMRLEGHKIEETQPLLDQVQQAHTVMQDLLTSLRLLAPAQLIVIALEVHDTHHAVINAAFGQSEPQEGDASWGDLRAEAKATRLSFVNQARRPLDLTPAQVDSGGDAWSSWTVPADVRSPDLSTRWFPSSVALARQLEQTTEL